LLHTLFCDLQMKGHFIFIFPRKCHHHHHHHSYLLYAGYLYIIIIIIIIIITGIMVYFLAMNVFLKGRQHV